LAVDNCKRQGDEHDIGPFLAHRVSKPRLFGVGGYDFGTFLAHRPVPKVVTSLPLPGFTGDESVFARDSIRFSRSTGEESVFARDK